MEIPFFGHLIKRFCVDSRSILPGDLYVALPGQKVHGEDFVQEALDKGAALALVSKGYLGKKSKDLICVENVLETLQMLAKDVFEKARPKFVIAITGSLGKTTTKEFIASLLEEHFTVFKSPGNANSQVGLPLSILNGFDHQEVAVLEMGMTHPGQIKKLVEIAPPDIALITKVALVHAENFSSLDDIIETKGEIFWHPSTQVGIFPAELKGYCFSGTCVKETFSLEDLQFSPPFSEPHLLHNLAAAQKVALTVKPDMHLQFEKLTLPDMRMQKIKKKGVLFINDAYNAAPDSMIAALKSLPAPDLGKKRIAILGQMRELGRFSEECHRKVGIEALSCVDALICYGEECRPMVEAWETSEKPFWLFHEHAPIVDCLKSFVESGDVVLLKGSNSTKMWTILDRFDI